MSDFGYQDVYVGVMKCVMLARNPNLRLIDLCHCCGRGNIVEAAFLLFSAWQFLPPSALVLCVVDPGVGSDRRELVATGAGRTYVGPDNGTISLVSRFGLVDRFYRADPLVLEEIERLGSGSATFHGRDLFAPIIAEFSIRKTTGEACSPVLLDMLKPKRENGEAKGSPVGAAEQIHGSVLHVDHFGNVITSFHEEEIPALADIVEVRSVGDGDESHSFRKIGSYYAEVSSGSSIVYVGSTGFVEVAVRNGSAAERYGLRVGDALVLVTRSATG